MGRQGLRNVWEAAARAPLNERTDQVIQTLVDQPFAIGFFRTH
jgi:hypothetical protein